MPFNSFAEYAPEPNPETKNKDVVWFAHGDDCPLFSFAGMWTDLVYGFLTTEPDSVVAPIHLKAMPVILTTDEERVVWLRAPWVRLRRYRSRSRTIRSRS